MPKTYGDTVPHCSTHTHSIMLSLRWLSLFPLLLCFSVSVSDSTHSPPHSLPHSSGSFVLLPAAAGPEERRGFKRISKHTCSRDNVDHLLDWQYSPCTTHSHTHSHTHNHDHDHSQSQSQSQSQSWDRVNERVSEKLVLFSPHKFLTPLTNKSLTVVGDSLGLQLFYSLDAVLFPLRSSRNHSLTRPKSTYHLARGDHYYRQYNATLTYVLAPTFSLAHDVLTHSLTHTDVLLIAVGAWYKPGFLDRRNPPNLTKATEFFDSAMRTFRHSLTHTLTHDGTTTQRVIWQLCTHMGPSDDERYKSLALHTNGSFWDTFPHEAEWVSFFNQRIRQVSAEYGDSVLDLYTVSKQLLHHASALRNNKKFASARGAASSGGKGGSVWSSLIPEWAKTSNSYTTALLYPFNNFPDLQVHVDSLHFCQGGVFRAAGVLLQQLLCDQGDVA